MKVFKQIFITLLFAITAVSGTLFAATLENISSNTKLAAISKAIRDQKATKDTDTNSLLKVVYFENNIPQFLELDGKFSDPADPEYIELGTFLKHFDFFIDGNPIPVYESRAITIQKGKPVTFSIKAKRGKLESLLALVKTSTQDWFKAVYSKAANLLSFAIRYKCLLHEDDIHYNNTVFMDELVYKHPDMREICKNPSSLMNKLKKYLTWSEWFGLEAQLPDLAS
jgi:hypothetical protein